MSCFENIHVENLDQCINAEVQAGVSEVGVHYAVHKDITNFPMPVNFDDPTFTYEKAVEVSAPIVFAAGKGFGQIVIQSDTGEVQLEAGGNKGNKKLKSVFPFFVAGNDKKLLGFIRTRINTPMLFCVTERNGQKRLIGDKFNPAYMSEVKGTTGKGGDDDKGVQFSIESYCVPIVYEGALQLPVSLP
jgi:hypothetical protein